MVFQLCREPDRMIAESDNCFAGLMLPHIGILRYTGTRYLSGGVYLCGVEYS